MNILQIYIETLFIVSQKLLRCTTVASQKLAKKENIHITIDFIVKRKLHLSLVVQRDIIHLIRKIWQKLFEEGYNPTLMTSKRLSIDF